jgi:hypothetical protein
MTYVNMIEDKNGDLVDIEYYDSALCFTEATGREAYGNACPGGSETDYNVHCDNCGDFMWLGLEAQYA